MRVLSLLFCRELTYFFLHWLKNSFYITLSTSRIPSIMPVKKMIVSKVDSEGVTAEMSLLGLPELALECILGKLSPAELCSMGVVCSSLRDMCRSDHLWQRHMKEKWGHLIGPAAQREWQVYVSWRKNHLVSPPGGSKQNGWLGSLSCMWPLHGLRSIIDTSDNQRSSLPVDSIMSWYLALESGSFWFPAQVYNRESGHLGFTLSCYDAELSYDSHTDTFHARYPPYGQRPAVLEEGVQWDRLRAPPTEMPAHHLHTSDCLKDLRPGDHIEIQWQMSKEIPYGWWYGVVGHLEFCDGNEYHCRCHSRDKVMVEFKQYTVGSHWRQVIINRKEHWEEGNEADGFYGGIRKLNTEEEIATWRRLWPSEVLD